MGQTAAARTTARRTLRLTALGLVVVTVAIIGSIACGAATAEVVEPAGVQLGPGQPLEPGDRSSAPPPPGDIPPRDHGGASTEDDGALPDGVTVFDDQYPGIANLNPDLLQALREAAADAGITFSVSSGWRSREYQSQLLREAVGQYGSEAEAARWVATADTSPHVSGNAVDIGSTDATAWLSEHGAKYGLCQTYRNEPWHYERRPQAIDRGCPPMYADPTHDPRMRP